MPSTLDRTRTAMTFSLWAWAAYWPAMGLMLALGGMGDPVSLAVIGLSLGGFGLLAAGGALRATASRTMKEFLLERPIYLIAGVLAVLVVGSLVPAMANVGLALFSGTFLASLVLVGWRLVQHVNESGQGVFKARADQIFLVLLLVAPCALLVLIDALGGAVGNPAMTVAGVNWICLAYPPLLLLASRPMREPLGLLRRKARHTKVVPVPALAE